MDECTYAVSPAAMQALNDRIEELDNPRYRTSAVGIGTLLGHLHLTQRGDRLNPPEAVPLRLRTSQPAKALFRAVAALADNLTVTTDKKPVSASEVASWCLEQHAHKAKPLRTTSPIMEAFQRYLVETKRLSVRSSHTYSSQVRSMRLDMLEPDLVIPPKDKYQKVARTAWFDFLAARMTPSKTPTPTSTPEATDGLDL